MTRWTVTAGERQAFARWSGDHNPFHTDPVASRRLPFGRVSVHGMLLVLDALERVCRGSGATPHTVAVTFRHPVGDGDPIDTSTTGGGDAFTVTIASGPWRVADVKVTVGDPLPPLADPGDLPPAPDGPPAEPDLGSVEGGSAEGTGGELALAADLPALAARVPALAARLGHRRLAELVALTRLVGMHLPGLHSLDSALTLEFDAAVPTRDGVAFTLERYDPRFRRATLRVDGAGVRGRIVAFHRHPPVAQQPDVTRVVPGEFAGQRWLVMGGSRGLGAVAVALLRAGGADVTPTYRVEPVAGGVRYDALADSPASLAAAGEFDALAWFATPPYTVGMAGAYHPGFADGLRAVWIDAFAAAVAALPGLRVALWPSSTMLDDPPEIPSELLDVRREGETRAHALQAATGVRVVAHRFGHLLTDQTLAFVPTEYGDTTGEMLTALRASAPDLAR